MRKIIRVILLLVIIPFLTSGVDSTKWSETGIKHVGGGRERYAEEFGVYEQLTARGFVKEPEHHSRFRHNQDNSISEQTVDEKIWDYFCSKGISEHGAAGLMGNLFAESGLNAKNLQGSYSAKLDMSDEEYTNSVDNGSYSNFVMDNAGYGLAQWTYWSRKQGLIDHANERGVSIGDLEMQLNYIYKELCEEYSNVLKTLETTSSIQEASNAVLFHYEKPYNQSESTRRQRVIYCQQFFDKYASAGVGQIERGEVG